MVLLVFLNEKDIKSYLLGRKLLDFLKGDFVKIYTRFEDKQCEKCEIKDTMKRIREHAEVFDKLAVSFGLRIFPPSAYKELLNTYRKTDKSLVFLKKLKGSKTWSIKNDKLIFDNYRLADSGLFIFSSKDIKECKSSNFNSFLKELILKNKLDYKLIPYWLFTNSARRKQC